MELIERAGYLDKLTEHFRQLGEGVGHTVFLGGEAGVGKTSLVNQFIKNITGRATIYSGACDSLFSPRPLGPLYDIAAQANDENLDPRRYEKDRSLIFTAFLQKFAGSKLPIVLVFEDIHWADEATIDFIKFLARRITKIRCLFLLTYRHDEIQTTHPVARLFGELAPNTFSKIQLLALTREAVGRMAAARGYGSGDKVFALTGGNPFYVTEVLANGSTETASGQNEIPEKVKDSILAVFHSKEDEVRAHWELLSILPSRIENAFVDRMDEASAEAIEDCIRSGVLIRRNDHISFKHELLRLAIEQSLSSYRRKNLHRQVLKIMLDCPADSVSLSQLIHHARIADEREFVSQHAPKAAEEASAVGAHLEASKLYLAAIEFSDKDDPSIASLYERHAYECYLTNQIKDSIASQKRAVNIWKEQKMKLRVGDTLRFLSRVTWFDGRRDEAMTFALEAIEVLENGFPTRERALAYSNLSQLNMLADRREEALHWGQKAMALAARLDDQEILCHALNNVGAALMRTDNTAIEGEEKLRNSLAIALQHGYHEHAARAYTNLASNLGLTRRFEKARQSFDEGIRYCEDLDLLSWSYYMLNDKTRLLLDVGDWAEAERVSLALQNNPASLALTRIGATVTLARLNIRRGNFEEARSLIRQGKELAKPTGEVFRIAPFLAAELELCWTNREAIPVDEMNEADSTLFPYKNESWNYGPFAYWMHKCGLTVSNDISYPGPFAKDINNEWLEASEQWKQLGCPFEQALALLECDGVHQKMGFTILEQLGATATIERAKNLLRERGALHVPRGLRKSTRSNAALLTNRQIEILLLLKDGAANKDIADKLFISPKTVDHHITAILSKLEVNSRGKAVLEAQKLGILK